MDTQPVLALHGWQDNAASFDPLMSLLPNNLSTLAIDLPGHGLSSHYPQGCMYHFTEDLVTLRRVIHYFKWKKVSIMGHSMGGSYAFLYAAFFPKEVEKIICFDIVRPFCLEPNQFEKTGGAYIDQYLNLINSDISAPEYSENEIIERQFKASNESISKNSSKVLLTRGACVSKKNENLFRLTRDVRLKYCILLHSWPHEFLLQMASKIECEVMNIKARPGMYYENPQYYEETLNVIRASAKKVEYHEVPGTHHSHLNNPEYVAQHVINFLQQSDSS